MRRIVFGIVWFLVFSIGGLALGGGIVGAVAGNHATSYEAGYAAGHSAGEDFGRKYGRYLFLGSLLLAVGGSAFGILPGTKPKSSQQKIDA